MKTKLIFFVSVLSLVLLLGITGTTYASGKTLYVPKDFATLQEAINAAEDGDTISVAEGTYKGNINFKGKSITLTSDSANTIIEGTESGSVVTIDSNAILKGFTITSGDIDCRGIYIIDASPTIEDCIIVGNKTTQDGSGIYATENSSSKIVNCIITENSGKKRTTQVAGGNPYITDSYVEDQGLVTGSAVIEEGEQDEQVTVPEDNLDTGSELTLPYQQGELLVRFAPVESRRNKSRMRTASERTDVLGSASRRGKKGSMTIKRNFKVMPNLSLVKLPEGMDIKEAMEVLNSTEGILYAEPNYQLRAFDTFIPNDDLFEQQWALDNTGQTGGTIDVDIDAAEAWYVAGYAEQAGPGHVIVAVIDSGVDYTHPDLAPNMWINTGEIPDNGIDDDGNDYIDDVYGYNFVAKNGDPLDDHLHGTHCAGIIGAVDNNEIGVAGVSSNVKIMALKFLDSLGLGLTSDAIGAIEYSMMMGAKVINASWGGSGYSTALKDTIDLAGDAGIVFVAAAGNDSSDIDIPMLRVYPAGFNCNNIVTVMSTDHNDEKASTSNWGATTVDIAAPGDEIISTFPTYMTSTMQRYGFSTYYETIGGTSMATPHVAGAYALLWSKNPTLTYSKFKNVILQTSDKIPSLDNLCVSEGRLNLLNAINAVQAWYVDDDAPAGGDGKSWDTAFKYLQDALSDTQLQAGDGILVAQGTYRPDQDKNNPDGTGDKTATFQLVDNVIINGGYAGIGAVNPNERNIETYQTILSGYIGTFINPDSRCYHVVTANDINSTAVLDGFTITDGKAYIDQRPAQGDYRVRGAGIFNYNSSVKIANCTFENNFAFDGGGMYNNNSSSTITNCVFRNNSAYSVGGGIENVDSSPQFTNCVFSENATTYVAGGGGVNNRNSSPKFTNCVFSNNSGMYGSAIRNSDSAPEIINSSFSGNYSFDCYAVIYNTNSSPIITNCILWDYNEMNDEAPEIVNVGTSEPIVTYCNVRNGYGGEGNIGSEPLFLDVENPAGPDDRFLTSDDGLQLTLKSPCIDIADDAEASSKDILGQARVDIPEVGLCKVDMGAYEFTGVGVIWYVDDSSSYYIRNGKSWETAFKYLQDALNNPQLQAGNTILVAQGTYRPDQESSDLSQIGNRSATFRLKNDVTVKGGYSGIEATDPNERDIQSYKTILSGDLSGNDGNPPDFVNYGDNSYHVVTAIVTDNSAVLDGFTITGGNATGSSEKAFGGGLFNRGTQAGSPTIINCIFTYNRAYYGGAVHNGPFPGSPPKEQNKRTVLNNCIFDHNTSREGGAINGGLLNITNCVFTNNTADAGGRYGYGGAIAGGDGETTNCTFYGNTAVTHGGAICTGVRSMTITNSIFWGNSNDIVGSPFIHYCDVENPSTIGDNRWIRGTGNISADPLFTDTENPFLHGLRLSEGSPCINTANDDIAPLYDVLGRQRIDDADMGAYEYFAKTIWYVDDDASIDGNGESWDTAFKCLQDALKNPDFRYYCDEIWVGQGTYRPDLDKDTTIEELNDRTSSFQIKSGVILKGGYAGIGAENPDERDIEAYQTILSGHIGKIMYDYEEYYYTEDNSYHVVTAINANATSAIDGFIITGGYARTGTQQYPASDDYRERGAGILNKKSDILIQNCKIIDNFGFEGGGIFNLNSEPTIENCVFSDNSSFGNGGGLYNLDSSPKITNCIFSGNSNAYIAGGAGISNKNSSPIITNCVFSGNSAIHGSDMANYNSFVEIINCSFSGDYRCYGSIYNTDSNLTVTNSILWTNEEVQIYNEGTPEPIVTYSDVQTGYGELPYPGEANINAEPLFVDTDNPAGSDGIFFTSDDGLQLTLGSPCIDTANDSVAPPADILGEERIDADMGAYEYID
ncbi:MAG: S8 family serine peptidase [Candidatus Ratteibacteria bacterium]|nr:S8 family serine peptidase [Candidatus Ratteibacteria bacterium]